MDGCAAFLEQGRTGRIFYDKKFFEWGDKRMTIRTVLEGNSFYEIDEECMEQRLKERGMAVAEQGRREHGAADAAADQRPGSYGAKIEWTRSGS